MKHQILLLTIITVFTTSNIFAQITWDNATNIEIANSGVANIIAGNTDIYTQYNGGIYKLNMGELTFYYDTSIFLSGSGPVGSRFDGWTYNAYNLETLSVMYSDDSGISMLTGKGDTTVYSDLGDSFLKIGTADPVELSGSTNEIIGHVIMNGHIFVYEYLSATQTTVWDFDVNDLANPTSEIIDEYVYSITFLDSLQVKFAKINSEYHVYFHEPSNGWQQVDDNIFNGNYYYDYAISYYGDNNDICITGLHPSDGNLIQVYTAGLPSTEHDILTFSFAEQTGDATINSTNHTVNIEVANGTNLTNLVATFTLSDLATAFIGATEQTSGTWKMIFQAL